ncbi:MAG: hypothetical protein ACK56I_04835, partial [bacterium]
TFQRPGGTKPVTPGNLGNVGSLGNSTKLPGSSPLGNNSLGNGALSKENLGKGNLGNVAGSAPRPGQRPGGGPTSEQLSEFLGGKPSAGRLDSLPATRPNTLPGSVPGRGDSPLAKDRPSDNRPLDNRPGTGSGVLPGKDSRPDLGKLPGENQRPAIGNRDLGDRTAI